jgi:hypothetical protein
MPEILPSLFGGDMFQIGPQGHKDTGQTMAKGAASPRRILGSPQKESELPHRGWPRRLFPSSRPLLGPSAEQSKREERKDNDQKHPNNRLRERIEDEEKSHSWVN